MNTRLLSVLNVCLLFFAFSTKAYAALANASVIFNWDTFNSDITGDLVVSISGEQDSGSACANLAPCDFGSTSGFGGLDLSSSDSLGSAALLTTEALIDASANTLLGFSQTSFERAFSYEALSGSGMLSLSVEIEIQAEVQGAGAVANADALFGYSVGNAGVLGSLAGLEMYGESGDQNQTLISTLSFSVFMSQGDVINMFAEGEADTQVSPIPIPHAAWLFGSGLLGLIGIARRKKTT